MRRHIATIAFLAFMAAVFLLGPVVAFAQEEAVVRARIACDAAGNMKILLPDGAAPSVVLDVPKNLCQLVEQKQRNESPPPAEQPKERPTRSPRTT